MSVIDKHTISARIAGTSLDVKSATITLDETWAPYGQGTLVCALPDDLDLIDPRNLPIVSLELVQDFGAGAPLSTYTAQIGGSVAAFTAAYGGSVAAATAAHFTAYNTFGVRSSTIRALDLLLRRREIDWQTRTATLEVATGEALLQDYALVATAPVASGSTSVRDLVIVALGLVGKFLQVGTADGTIDPDASEWTPGTFAWNYLAPLVQAAGLRLYCDERGRWYLVNDTQTQPGQLTIVEAQNLTADRDIIDRDGDWYDAVVITYEWTDDLGATQRAWDTASAATYSKVLPLTYKTPYPGPGAAARVLERSLGRGRVQEVRAVSDYSATPSQPVSITVVDDDTQAGYLSSVAWAFPAAEMDVKSRGLVEIPPTAWAYDPAGVPWTSIPVGTDWTED